MTFDEATVMAFVDGELDALTAARVERAAAADSALAAAIAAQRALGTRLSAAFAGIADAPVPDRLTGMIATNVVPLRPRSRARWGWAAVTGIAASLLGIVALDHPATDGSPSGTAAIAGPLAQMLDDRLASATGDARVLLSFRDRNGAVCRVFTEPAEDGIACRATAGWSLQRTQPNVSTGATTPYRQAGSDHAALLAAAQDMMVGSPLDASAERHARDIGWR